MLVLRRNEGQWIELTHKSGEVLRFRVYNIRTRPSAQLDIAFDDQAKNFKIQRLERVQQLKEAEVAISEV